MTAGVDMAAVAALVGDPGRANMLAAMLDGRAHTASELAGLAGVTAQTASGHLARLERGRLVSVAAQGRHRYYRLASSDVARMLEGMMVVAAEPLPAARRATPRIDPAMRRARTCYDHIAGELGVAIADALVANGAVALSAESATVTPRGRVLFADLGIPLEGARGSRRITCRPCLDWSERRPHIAGGLGGGAVGQGPRCRAGATSRGKPGARRQSGSGRQCAAGVGGVGLSLGPVDEIDLQRRSRQSESTMPALTVALLLFAAFLHASWNTILRAGVDRLWSITIMGMVGGVSAAGLALFLPTPAPASWPFIAASAILQIGYSLFLVRAYRDGHLAHVYPIARGVAPMLVTFGAWVLAAERPTPPTLIGVVLVSSGIVTLAFGRDRPDGRTIAAALATGGFIASYMVTDGLGVRLSGQAVAYAAWLSAAQGVGVLTAFVSIRRRFPDFPRGRGGAVTCGAALIGTLSYGIALWAMSRSPMSQVSALRETSILFAALLGAVMLREPLTPQRVLGGVSIGAGAVCLAAF